jgi:hypothetical protein
VVRLDGEPISFAGRPYLPAIYAAPGNLVIRASRQVEKSTFLANSIVYEACTNPKAKILLVSPRIQQVRAFCKIRLFPTLWGSPVVRRTLLGKKHELQIDTTKFSNGAQLYVRAAFRDADSCRGLSANLLLVDEVQDVAANALPVLRETLSHAAHPRTILTGTPKLVDNQLEGMFAQSTANLWTMLCSQCQAGVTIDERSLGPTSLACPTCQSPLDVTQGSWVPRNPNSTWGRGYSISHPMVPWMIGKYEEILERQRNYDAVQFRNEVLGLPVALGEHCVTRAELEACCGSERMIEHGEFAGLGRRVPLFAGIDWGGGARSRTIIVLAIIRDNVFEIKQITALPAREDPNRVLEEVARICNYYQVATIAADGNGNGHVYNRLLFGKVQPSLGFYSIYYSCAGQEPAADGVLWKWTVHRSRWIGALFARVRDRKLVFPCRTESDPFLDEFACETAEHDDQQRSVKYTHPETQRDDALHATAYAMMIATRHHSAARQAY